MNSPTSQLFAVTRSVEHRIVRISWPVCSSTWWAHQSVVDTPSWLSLSTDGCREVFENQQLSGDD